MSEVTSIIGLVFDFDDTLAPDSTSKLLRTRKIDVEQFWKVDAKALVQQGYDPTAAYLRLVFDNIGPNKPLGNLTNAELREFGASLDSDFYPGLPRFFDDISDAISRDFKNIKVEFYIVSGGLQEIILGSKIVNKYFPGRVYGCQLGSDTEGGVLKYIKRMVTFTEKTRYLFEINKGLPQSETLKNPVLVNKSVPPSKRRIPMKNMIYVGDGLTDIPCFSLIKSMKGMAFGVFDPAQEGKAKQALQEFLKPDRVVSMHSPRYDAGSDLGALLKAAAHTMASQIQLEREQAESNE